MNSPCAVWPVATLRDAARARALVARLTTAADVPLPERARFLTALTAHLRECLADGGAWELSVGLDPAEGDGRTELRVTASPADGREPRWRLTVPCPRTPRPDLAPAPEPDPLPEALLAADDDAAGLLTLLAEQEDMVRFHREELQQTNHGVLALHAELDAAVLAQRELLEAERVARSEAERARRLLSLLADASAAVTSSLEHEAVLHRLIGFLVPEYASHVDVWLFDDEQPARGAQHAAAAVAAARTGRPKHAAGHPVGVPGVDDLPPSVLSVDRPLLAVPLMARTVFGVLTLTAPGPRFHPDTCVMLVELVRRAAVALDNARRYEQHRETAEALQRAQLTELPAVDGLRLAARYLPATRGLNIGGDWYDAFRQPDGAILAVIGDVTGHGLHAAVVMGQLRTALRAYAVDGDSPAGILTRLHRMLRHQQPELYATALVARFRPGHPRAEWAAAGHPPAVLRAPDGAVTVLDAKPGVMLGVPIPYEYEDHALDLLPGSTLALYTDGLVERRADGIDRGIERLAHALAGLSPADLEDLDASAESLLKPMLHDSERDDDVCLLLCRTLGPGRSDEPSTE
ncbi:PP2C family protein-serine/threonine phosphatase [Streptomyces sp. bgisy159]|uniref:PP2C family protein-serine/threonine phosphatase n=1 Tax=Streptomyces sp. bgisy159 TaxID=3413795 RepID=UPI003F4A5EBE